MGVLKRFSMRLFAVAACTLSSSAFAQDLNEQLLAAARKGDAAEARALLEKGALVNSKTRYGATPLSYACDRGNVEMVKLLLDRGADVNAKDTFYGATPMDWAAMKNHADVVRLLIQKGGSKETALDIAAGGGHTAVAQVALEAGGFSPEVLSRALAAATRGKHTEIIELLKKAGAVIPAAPEFKVDAATLKSYEGTFRNDQLELVFKVNENKLTVKPSVGQQASLNPTAKHTFTIPESPVLTLIFTLDGEKVTGVTLKQPNGETKLKKVEVQ
jgi:ankyrin repeat protein